MKNYSRGGRIWLTAILMLSLLALTACSLIKPKSVVVLPESKVQKISAGESASFDGYLLTPGAVSKLLETAERCKGVQKQMTIQYSTAVRNAMADAYESTISTAPKLRLYTGAQPTNCAAAATGTLLAEIACPSDWLAAASSGAKTILGSWTVAAIAPGTAGYYRIYDTAGTTCHDQGSVTITGSGGDLTLDNPVIAAAQVVTITSWTKTMGGA